VGYENYIDDALKKTASGVKAVDVTVGLMVLVTGGVGLLLLVALLDHWLIPGGLGTVGRTFFFLVLVGGGGYYFFTRIVPLILGRINPAYSAYTIEQSTPSLKNSLLNLLLFRGQREAVPEVIYEALQQQAATGLSRAPVEAAIDRTKVIRVGYVLVAIVVLACLYLVLSPKSPLASARRVLLPWSDLQAPSRVQIAALKPGDTQIVRGEHLVVSAEIEGNADDEPVLLVYSTDDGQTVEQSIPMHVPPEGYSYSAKLPESPDGVQSSLRYWITAGDARSRTYRAEVVSVPTLVVERIDFEYPSYTGLSARSSPSGDIRGLEGTQVTIHARSNGPIDTASIDFDCDGRSDRTMRVEGSRATASFTLALNDDRTGPVSESYCLSLVDPSGARNRDPAKHKIEVLADLPPEVELLAPQENEIEVPLNGLAEIEVRAVDPDFALRSVALQGIVGSQVALKQKLLDEERPGQFTAKFRLTPSRQGLKVGDRLEYWATAVDSKSPRPNRAESEHRYLLVTEPMRGKPADDPLAQNDRQPPQPGEQPQDGQEQGDEQQPGEQGGEPQPGEQPGEQGQETGEQGEGSPDGQPGEGSGEGEPSEGAEGGQGGASQDPQGDAGEESGEAGGESVANDGSDDGRAFEEFLKEIEEEQNRQAQPGQGAPNDQPQPGEQQGPSEGGGEGQPQPGEGQSPEGGQPNEGQGDSPQPGEQNNPSEGGGESTDRPQPKPGEGQQQPQPQEGQPNEGQPTEGQPTEGQPNEGQPNEGQSQENQPQSPDAGSQPEGQPQPGEQPQGDMPQDGQGGQSQDNQPQTPDGGQQPQGQPSPGDQQQPGGKQGDGAQSDPGSNPSDDKRPPEGGERPEAQGGDPQNDKGDSGAGRGGADDAGSPEAQTDIDQTTGKQENQGQDEPSEGGEKPKSPAHGNKESNSDGSQGGDKPGGGEEGGGQKANRDGTGSAGQNTAADEGGGEATEAGGDGAASDQTGDDSRSEKGADREGSKEQGAGGESRGAGDQAGGEEQGPQSDDANRQGNQQPGSSGAPTGGGKAGEGDSQSGAAKDEGPSEPGGDDANLEYAREATELVLDRLKHQMDRDQLDREALDKLGWTKDDLRKFIDRWENLRRQARAPGESGQTAQRELDEAIRSLGIRKDRTSRRGGGATEAMNNLRETNRTPAPAEYAEQLRAYQKGLSRAGGRE
jgi:hypothetical protein